MPPLILGPTLRLSLAYFNARCISRAVFWSEDQIAALANNLRRISSRVTLRRRDSSSLLGGWHPM